MRRINASSIFLFACFSYAFFASSRTASALSMQWSAVGNAGNANDPLTGNLYGGVAYDYKIGTYDVTNNQYAEFLNAKDPTGANTLGLWNTFMADATYGGITFNSSNLPGSKFVLVAGRQEHPVNYVSWYSSIRFANWLNNGQGSGDTETGAYTLGPLGADGVPTNGQSIVRNAGASVFLPSENEWYKAAYYNPATNSYFKYGTSSNVAPVAIGPTATPNSANWNSILGNLTDVGAYSGTTSPYGAFDMSGNINQWNESLSVSFGTHRVLRGGSFLYPSGPESGFRVGTANSTNRNNAVGFRVAAVPEPSTLVLAIIGCGLGFYWRKRRA